MAFSFPSLSVAHIWLAIGLIGQSMFFMRFFVQWLATERARQSVIPTAFWYFSVAGGVILLSYAIYRQDPVFIIGQSTGVFIYLRNLYFVLGKNKAEQQAGASS